MNARRWILWQPEAGQRTLLLAGVLAVALLLGWLHFISGLAYEFHVFFVVPVLFASWYLGFRPALGLALLTAWVWFVVDRRLGGDQDDLFPLIFNSGMRLALFVGGAWLLWQMRRVLDRETRLAREDSLTGLNNRRAFHERGRDALDLSHRQGAAFTAVFIDIDRFKDVNDRLGHEAGDALLRRVAEVFRAHVRASDIAGRLGGDEFALLLPGMGEAAALAYVEDLRGRLLQEMRAAHWPVTFSIGVASCSCALDDFDGLLAEADRMMYEAKEGGRDRIRQSVFAGENRCVRK